MTPVMRWTAGYKDIVQIGTLAIVRVEMPGRAEAHSPTE